MTDLMADDGNPVREQGESAPYVVRLSRTATGTRTYTVGASLTASEDLEAAVARLFALEALVVDNIDGKAQRSARYSSMSVAASLRRSILVEKLRRAGDWLTTAEMVGPNEHRSQVVADLAALVKADVVEYERGKGGNYPSRYRLAAQEKGAAK